MYLTLEHDTRCLAATPASRYMMNDDMDKNMAIRHSSRQRRRHLNVNWISNKQKNAYFQ